MSSPVPGPSYRAVMRVTGAHRFLIPALLGRSSYGLVSLALVLSVVHATGSYAHVGVVGGIFGATVAALSPLRARLIDRHGPCAALPPMAVLFALALLGLAVTTWSGGADLGVLVALAVMAGACAPPLGPVTRSLWSHLIADRALLQRAYSLDTVVEELIFLGGPLLLGALLPWWPPPIGLVVGALLVSTGTWGLVTSPVARSMSRRSPESPSAPAPAPGTDATPRPVARGGLLTAVALSGAAGAALGAAGLVNVAFAEQHGRVEAVVFLETLQTAGGVVGGLVYGAVSWRAGARARLVLISLALGGGVAAAAFAPGVAALSAVLFVVGVVGAPLITTSYLLADESVTADRRTRAGNWVNTAYNAGSSVGGAAIGVLLTLTPPGAAYTMAGGVLVVVTAAALPFSIPRRRVRPLRGSSGAVPSATSARRRR
ncbi:MFS transporter [Nocardiopsis alba]|uniref:MFS transporter n=1 Tax=Nocardiopsis alba TaxID=53437 RepID=UPI0033A79FBC